MDGTLLFLGRVDHQVKVRGYRVELGEIEAALEQHPAVRDAVVLALDDGAAGKRLAAFAVSEAGVTPAELTAFLASRLPGYMVPGAITVLDALPITPNGKVDRRALEALEAREAPAEAVEEAPRGPVEEVLEAIWADVFDRERVGIHERFDALGGHSLLAIQVIARVRDAFQVEVPLRAIFEAPTIAELAERIEALRREGGAPVVPPIERAPRGEPLPLSFAQERLWFLDQIDPGSPLYNVPSGRRLHGPLDAAALERALREVVRRHEVLRTTFAVIDGSPVQVIHDEVDLRLPVEDLSALPETEREARVAEEAAAEARRPFDLARGPVLRARLLQLGPEEHVLFVVLHHIVSDAWTQGVLLDEVGKLYAAFLAGEPSPLPPLPVQYADYAVWQRRWLSGEVLERQVAWWKAHLSGAPAALELPTDRPRPAVMSHRARRQPSRWRRSSSRALARPGQARGRDALHGAAVGVRRAALALVGAARRGGGHAHRRPDAGGDGGPHRVLRQHAGAPRRARRRRGVPRSARAGAGAVPWGLRTPGSPVRAPGGGAPPRARPRPHAALPGGDRAPERAAGGRRARRAPARAAWPPTAGRRSSTSRSRSARRLAGSRAAWSTPPTSSRPRRSSGCSATSGRCSRASWRTPNAPSPSCRCSGPRSGAGCSWSGTTRRPPTREDACVHALFEAQAGRTPNAVAVASGGRALTYRELSARANRLANHLRARGVGPDVLVGLCAERSVDLVVGMLGILKAGGAYVPLDPDVPARAPRLHDRGRAARR